MPADKKLLLTPKSWFSLLIIFFLLLSIVFTQLATFTTRDNRTQAATCSGNKVTLRPDSDKQVDWWAQVPSDGRSYFEKVADAGSGDGDSTYIWDDTALTGGSVAAFGHPSGGLSPGVHRITSVTVGSNVRQNQGSQTGPYVEMGVVVGGKQYFSPGTKFHPPPNNTYAVTEYTWPTDPSTGAEWSVNNVNALWMAARSTRLAQPNALLMTQIWLEVCYTNLPPSADIKANGANGPITIAYNSSASISWTSANANACTVSPGGWNGTGNSGISTGNLTASTTYVLTCTGSGGSSSDSVLVNVASPPPVPKPAPKPPPSSPLSTNPPANSNSGDPSEITVNFAANFYWQASAEVSLVVSRTNLNQKYNLGKGAASLQLKANGILQKGQNYVLQASVRSSLIQKISFSYSDFTKVTVLPFTLGDFNGDNRIDQTDLDKLLASGFSKQENSFDLNFDNQVNSIDYSLFLLNLGKVGQ